MTLNIELRKKPKIYWLIQMTQKEEIEIRRKDGSTFALKSKSDEAKSPFDVPGVTTSATTEDVLNAVRESRGPGDKT